MGERDEKIALSKPIDKTAANVISEGEEYNFEVRDKTIMRLTPIRCGSFKGRSQDDLTGRIFGRLLVVGFRAKKGGNSHGRWVCKCTCGYFIVKKSKSLRKSILEPMCLECRNRIKMKNQYRTVK